MATSLLWARFSCHFVNVMPVFEETTWGRCEKAETQMTPFYQINPRWMGIFQSLGEGVVPQGGFSRVNRSQLRPPRPGPWSTNGPPILVHSGPSASARVGSVNNVGRRRFPTTPGKSNYFFTTRLWLLYQSPQSPHGVLATRPIGDVSQKMERTKSSLNQSFGAGWFFKGRVQPLMCLYVI